MAANMQYANTAALGGFFRRWRSCYPHPLPVVEGSTFFNERISCFLAALRGHLGVSVGGRTAAEITSGPDSNRLSAWFDSLREPMSRVRASGVFCNPWKQARLGRDEVRNAAVLAWLLDPVGDHGLGAVFLRGLLDEVHRCQSDLRPSFAADRVVVQRESYPENDQSNRVDIEIDSSQFYLLIEVKIDAPEGAGQLESYGEIAERQAGKRPWAIVFLTRNGGKSVTAAKYESRIVSLSWRKLAAKLRRALNRGMEHSGADDGFARRLAEMYVRHVCDL
ncbi:PD-(D/E)XK nuclease family protein [Azoarcus sp. CIB]|uniref:PDDEXK-like family protein n=1 Tax=Aromatoleum sp. (strain CIB) TaxID=198107 RepID=UPI0018DD9F4B|nr:PD-(D/E)XK nuclease family protein [Azoarcus sp. CIB]